MALSGAITVDSTAGGTNVIRLGPKTRMLVIANTGGAAATLKMDNSSTALTAANGHPLPANGTLVMGFNAGPDGPDVGQILIKGFCATSTTLVAQTIPN